MGLFKPYEQPAKATGDNLEPVAQTGPVKVAATKKSIPTPTRKQAEQARRQRIQPVLTRQQAKAKEREAKYKARDESMARVNARPYNAMIRDYVDGRWNLAEFILPLILLVFVATIIGAYWSRALTYVSSYVVWAIFALLIIDVVWMWLGLRTQLKRHFPDQPLKGKFSYALSRCMMMRRSRTPAPRVKRGTKFTWPPKEELR